MAGAERKRQKKLEQSRKKRELLKKQARQREARFQGAALLRTAQANFVLDRMTLENTAFSKRLRSAEVKTAIADFFAARAARPA